MEPQSNFYAGLHGFGNCPPNKPFLKVKRGIELMEQVVEEEKSDCLSKMELINRLLNVVTDRKMLAARIVDIKKFLDSSWGKNYINRKVNL